MRPEKIILCVDDNEDELSVLKFMLSTNGYRVLSATSGKEAIALFATEPYIDLVMADSQMPKICGVHLIEGLKRMGSNAPMILLRDPQGINAEAHMADAVVDKRISPRALLDLIKVMSARKRGPHKGVKRCKDDWHGALLLGKSR
jgi:two-component system, OmpR family, response regulator CpxR